MIKPTANNSKVNADPVWAAASIQRPRKIPNSIGSTMDKPKLPAIDSDWRTSC